MKGERGGVYRRRLKNCIRIREPLGAWEGAEEGGNGQEEEVTIKKRKIEE